MPTRQARRSRAPATRSPSARCSTQSPAPAHLAFKPLGGGDFAGAVAADLRAVAAIGEVLAGTGKPFVGTTGTMLVSLAGVSGRAGTEEDAFPAGPRIDAENLVIGLADRGVRSSIVRLAPLVHSTLDLHGFTPTLIAIARTKGVSAYVGDGSNRCPAVHTRDAARSVPARTGEGTCRCARLHAIGDEGIAFPVESLDPAETDAHFTYLAPFVGIDNHVSSTRTRALLGWEPTHPDWMEDLGHSFDEQNAV